eukprot:258644-Rhodomonas_salina.1
MGRAGIPAPDRWRLDVSVHGADDIDEGGWEVHGAHDIEQVLPSNPWVCIVLICEDNESWCACGVAVLYDILCEPGGIAYKLI